MFRDSAYIGKSPTVLETLLDPVGPDCKTSCGGLHDDSFTFCAVASRCCRRANLISLGFKEGAKWMGSWANSPGNACTHIGMSAKK
jgi:hypothetical protein